MDFRIYNFGEGKKERIVHQMDARIFQGLDLKELISAYCSKSDQLQASPVDVPY